MKRETEMHNGCFLDKFNKIEENKLLTFIVLYSIFFSAGEIIHFLLEKSKQ